VRVSDTAENTTEETAAGSFTEAVVQMEAAGYDSMGFSIDGSRIVCVECGDTHDEPAIGVGGMLRYATDGGEGHVFALACPSCDAKGLLFEAPDATVGTTADIVDALTARARH
jgi:hypothetical protein